MRAVIFTAGVTVAIAVCVQLLTSVTETVKLSAVRPLLLSVV